MKIGKKIVESGKKSYKRDATLDIFRALKKFEELNEIPDDFRYDIEKNLIEVTHGHAKKFMKERFSKKSKQKWTKNVVTGLKDRNKIFTKGSNGRVALKKCDVSEDIFEHLDSLIPEEQEAEEQEAEEQEAEAQ